jgi:hypothetical protein
MPNAATFALALLLPCAVWAQTEATPALDHFDGWPSSSQWGNDRLTFEATTGSIRQRLGLLTVAENGFGWRRAFTAEEGTFFRWAEISAWCSASDSLLIRTGEDRLPLSYNNIAAQDLTTAIAAYLQRYAADLELTGPDAECTGVALRAPDERDQIVELLKAASSNN